MSSFDPPESVVRFGEFAADLQAGELHRNVSKIKLQGQPFEILALLLEHPGRMVTREELHRRLWPADTFVDFEHGLNAAVNRLREALGDSAEEPRFIETVPRRGYKFIAPVDGAGASRSKVLPVAHAQVQIPRLRLLIGAAILVILPVVAVRWWPLSKRVPRVTTWTLLSFSGQTVFPSTLIAQFPALATDGSRLYFSVESRNTAAPRLAYISIAGGDPVLMAVPLAVADLRHISPDGSMLLVFGSVELPKFQEDMHLWLVPTTGGGARRLSNIDGHDGAWSPDGRQIAYASGPALYVAQSNGSDSRKLTTTPGKKAYWIRWSPDANRIRFTLADSKTSEQTLWECRADGTDVHRLPLSWDKQTQECCGEWTPDGRHFFFRAKRDDRSDIWLIREAEFLKGKYKATRLTTGPLDTGAAISSRNGKQLFAVEVQGKPEVFKYDLKTRQLTPFLAGAAECCVSTSPDGHWIAYVEGRGPVRTLWRSKPDGSERLQLTAPSASQPRPSWSPDGKQISYFSKMQDGVWKIHIVPASGGSPRDPLPNEQNVLDPEWSPDGHSLMFGRTPNSWGIETSTTNSISILNMDTNQITTLPRSEGLFSPHWSPNGRYVVAMPQSFQKLMLFDFATQTWTELASGTDQNPKIFVDVRWSPDSKYLYFNEFTNMFVMRIDRSSRKLEKIVDLKKVEPGAADCRLYNTAGEGAIWIHCSLASADIYALDLDLP